MSHPELYLITGISGSGKTTVARHLLLHGEVAFDSKINPSLYRFIDVNGTLAPDIQLNNEAWRRRYKWTLNEEKLNELLEKNGNRERVFLCGRANIFQYWHKANKVFLLKVDGLTLIERLNNTSRDNLFAKDAATQNRLLNDLDAVQNKITEKGAVVIDAKLPIEDVVNHILQVAELK